VLAEFFARTSRDSEYIRLLDSGPARPFSIREAEKWFKDEEEKNPPEDYFFAIRTLDGDQLIGFVALAPIYSHADAWLAIGIGDRTHWSQGHGSEAMRLALQYAFDELNLQRVTLGVFAYNQRAIRTYEKAGFKCEGTLRQSLCREGQRHDEMMMGILRDEWQGGRPA
jgi:RimJ/RimL family protein N-acetyltransferase